MKLLVAFSLLVDSVVAEIEPQFDAFKDVKVWMTSQTNWPSRSQLELGNVDGLRILKRHLCTI